MAGARDYLRTVFGAITGQPMAGAPTIGGHRTSHATLAGMSDPVDMSPTSDFWYSPLVPPGGFYMTEEGALSIGAVFSCVRVLAETVASLPLIVYQRKAGNERQRAGDHWMSKLLMQPNVYQYGWNWRTQMMAWLALRGVAYNQQLAMNAALGQGELRPLHPDRVTVTQQGDGTLAYRYQPPGGGASRDFLDEDLLVFRGLALDPLKPCSVVKYASDTLGMAKSMTEYGTQLFRNGAQPGGVLSYDGVLQPDARAELRRSWDAMHAGPKNAGRIAVLEDGMKWQQIGLTSEDAEFLATRKFSVSDIARWFRVPPHLVGDLERATFSNIEQQSLEFVIYSLQPWLVMIENTINARMLDMGEEFFVEHLVDGLLRGDSAARVAVYRSGINDGWMSQNEVRRLENLPKDDDPESDKLHRAAAMKGAAEPDPGGQDQNKPNQDSTRSPRPDPTKQARATTARILAKEVKTLERLDKESRNGSFKLQAEAFYGEHRRWVQQVTGCDAEAAERYCEAQLETVVAARDKALLPNLLHEWEKDAPPPAGRLLEDLSTCL